MTVIVEEVFSCLPKDLPDVPTKNGCFNRVALQDAQTGADTETNRAKYEKEYSAAMGKKSIAVDVDEFL